MKTSKKMKKLVGKGLIPISIGGYPIVDEDNGMVRLYPSLDPRKYYSIPKDCILGSDSEDDSEDGFTTVFVKPDCVVELHCIKTLNTSDLGISESGCNCDSPAAEMAPQIEEIRKFVIQFAEFLLEIGISKLTCRSTSSLGVGCCRAWNKLLDAVGNRGNVRDAANEVLAICFGVA